ncbi:MAG TPA: hypothetical protein PLF61_06495 [Candidatus Goldiibacteriota bacterium]|nr:hypothetical protein [Candidatus Goldiibacteriota bacterium]
MKKLIVFFMEFVVISSGKQVKDVHYKKMQQYFHQVYQTAMENV